MPQVDLLDNAQQAVEYAQRVRKTHRRRTARQSTQRNTDIQIALDRLREAMTPIRSEIGRFPYGPATEAAEIWRQAVREASQAIQRERRKLWKMRDHNA
jgi:hypothetical protein